MTDHEIRIRTLERQNRKLQERINRIKNTMIGNTRIWVLDRLAMECETEADLIDQSCVENLASQNEDDIWFSDERAAKYEQAQQHRADALFLRRLKYDLRNQHTAINDLKVKRVRDVDYVTGKYDPDNWRGPRP